jgi:hypothetical protein
MWIVPHFAAGCLIYETVKEQPSWIKWPLAVTGGLVSHWILDEVSTNHSIQWNSAPFNMGMIYLNVFCGLAIYMSYAISEGKILPYAIISGLLAWGIFDLGWLLGYGNWIHNADSSGFLPRYIRDLPATNWKSSLIQITFMIWATIVLVGKHLVPWKGVTNET